MDSFHYYLFIIYIINRCIRRFGFPNLKALEEGRIGTDCRGEEHEIVIVWSITSGKRQIIMDGREIHFSSNRVGLIDFSWNAKGNHVLKTVCHASAPMTPVPGFRQYELLIDGQSFFRMPKVFEMGVKGSPGDSNGGGGGSDHRSSAQYLSYGDSNNTGGPRSPSYDNGGYGGGGSAHVPRGPRSQSEEDAELQRAIQASLDESKAHFASSSSAAADSGPPDVLSSAPAPPPVDLLGFDSAPSSSFPAIMPDAQSSYGLSSQPVGAYGAPQPYGAPPAAYGAHGASQQQQFLALPLSQPYGSPPPAQYPGQQQQWTTPVSQNPQDQFAPQQQPAYGGGNSYYAPEDPFAPKPPSIQDVTNDILKAYGSSTPSSTTANSMGYGAPPLPQPSGYYQPGQPYQPDTSAPGGYYNQQQQQPQQLNGDVPLNMNGLAITESGEAPKNPFEATLQKLVNFDNIDQPADAQYKLTMKKQEDELAKKNRNKSVPFAPAGARVVGSGATLQQISTVKAPVNRECVMKPPVGLFQSGEDAAMAGALVVHGQGPPALQPRGFGVVHMQGQYPQSQQGRGYR